MLALDIGFKLEGKIREIFDQKNWERAYNKHDNIFRVVIEIEIASGRKTISITKLVRKAVLFWTRNPKIQHRIWVQIVKDDSNFYPLSVDEARTLLFDFNKTLEIEGGLLKIGDNKLSAKILVSWGKHLFTEPQKISDKSDEIAVNRST
jgi:hypothetical protein